MRIRKIYNMRQGCVNSVHRDGVMFVGTSLIGYHKHEITVQAATETTLDAHRKTYVLTLEQAEDLALALKCACMKARKLEGKDGS